VDENKMPRVSIGLAVYNGEEFLEEAILSILNQTYKDFELILSDNASTDRTQEICLNYAKKDSRIHYNRNPTNIGGANNENLSFRLSSGEFFRLAAHDDILHPDLIRSCVEILDGCPDVVLCYTQVVEIDEKGEVIQIRSLKLGSSDKPHERFRSLCTRNHHCEPTYGLIRSDILRSTSLEKNYTDSDRTLLCELSLNGKFHEIDKPLFFKRYHKGNLYLDWRTRMAWFEPSSVGKLVFPYWLQFFDFLRVIVQARLPLLEKIHCLRVYGISFLKEYFPRMIKDLVVVGNMLLHSKNWRMKRYEQTNNWS
jgi:glycosyltransferase involved in cell wall biosynthesis